MALLNAAFPLINKHQLVHCSAVVICCSRLTFSQTPCQKGLLSLEPLMWKCAYRSKCLHPQNSLWSAFTCITRKTRCKIIIIWCITLVVLSVNDIEKYRLPATIGLPWDQGSIELDSTCIRKKYLTWNLNLKSYQYVNVAQQSTAIKHGLRLLCFSRFCQVQFQTYCTEKYYNKIIQVYLFISCLLVYILRSWGVLGSVQELTGPPRDR